MEFLQAPHALMMIRPRSFGRNDQTTASNAFQDHSDYDKNTVRETAIREFDSVVEALKRHGVNVIVFEDSSYPESPDAIFLNNWISTHHKGQIILYPMEAPNRRLERRIDIVDFLHENYKATKLYDLIHFENKNKYLEGTGSIVFDHLSKKSYACNSSRMSSMLLHSVSKYLGYKVVLFDATDESGKQIYHTNVMMNIGSKLSVVCVESINATQQTKVTNSLEEDNKKIIEINYYQMSQFAGNVLEVVNEKNQPFLVMSNTAYNSLSASQVSEIQNVLDIIKVDIPTIERYGGGGVRCMLAGIHLPKK